MKLLEGNGLRLRVWDVASEPVYELAARPGGPPIKLNGMHLLDDAAARERLADLVRTGFYDRVVG